MPTVERTIDAHRPPDEVWAYLADFTTTREWHPPTVRSVRTNGDGTVGTAYRNVLELFGAEHEVHYVVTDYVDGSLLQLTGDSSTVHLLDTIRVERVPIGTRVTYRAHVVPHGDRELAVSLRPRGLAVLGDRVAQRLEERLSSPGPTVA